MIQKPPNPIRAFIRLIGRRGRLAAPDYFYQIIIVILGVYLGITLEGRASDYDRLQKARASLDHLVRDMRRDDADMSRVIEAQQAQARDYAELAEWLAQQRPPNSARIDSLLLRLTTSITIYPRRGVYASMIASGQIALLPASLSNSVINLYEHVYARLTANGEHYDYSLERDFFPAYARAWDPTRQGMITDDRIERIRFRNTVLLMHAWSTYYSGLAAESQAELRAVLADIGR